MFKYLIFALCFLMPAPAYAYPAKVVKIHDGDTITVLTENRDSVKIRLFGIDAPELGQAYGRASKRHLTSLASQKHVEVKKTGRDHYGRTLAVVYVNGQSLNELMVSAGYAWVYERYCLPKNDFCLTLANFQRQALNRRFGLWADKNPEPPWQWRRSSRHK